MYRQGKSFLEAVHWAEELPNVLLCLVVLIPESKTVIIALRNRNRLDYKDNDPAETKYTGHRRYDGREKYCCNGIYHQNRAFSLVLVFWGNSLGWTVSLKPFERVILWWDTIAPRGNRTLPPEYAVNRHTLWTQSNAVLWCVFSIYLFLCCQFNSTATNRQSRRPTFAYVSSSRVWRSPVSDTLNVNRIVRRDSYRHAREFGVEIEEELIGYACEWNVRDAWFHTFLDLYSLQTESILLFHFNTRLHRKCGEVLVKSWGVQGSLAKKVCLETRCISNTGRPLPGFIWLLQFGMLN